MRKFIALVAVTTVGLVAPASVGAATKKYTGSWTQGGDMSFKIKTTNDGKKLVSYKFDNFPVQCTGGPNTTSGHITFNVKVKRNKFDVAAVSGNPSNPNSRLDVTGNLKPGGTAEGTQKVSGSKVAVDSGGTSSCTSAKLDWTATS